MRQLLIAIASLIALVGPTATPAAAQAGCPQVAQADVASGWTLYRANDMGGAAAAFNRANRKCAGVTGASIGLGYIDLRKGDVGSARRRFDSALRTDSSNTDALIGRGTVAWRDGNTALVRTLFLRVQSIDPSNTEAIDYLARVPALSVAPERPPLVVADTTVYSSRTNGDRFEVRSANGWEPFYIKGMNLGAALPGRHPSEFPDSATYVTWIRQMADMGVNTIRVYTIHPPHFYQALHAYNRAHADRPLWIVHGVWAELPPKNDFDDAVWKRGFFGEMHRVVDVLHGRADITARPGHAHGHYTADVSEWTLAYIIGREWEPYAIAAYDAKSKRRSWQGKYLEMQNGTAADAWMAEASEAVVAYEMERYRAQRPVAYTNWPTLDPLTHPTETTVAQELEIRRKRGERIHEVPKEYDNDGFTLDPNLIRATTSLPAGWFAAYHAYPYYPDFMIHDTTYARARSSEGPSNYFGYLSALKRHHANMPVVIAEYGLPASIGVAHFQPQGLHHGGVTEREMADGDARMTREIAEAGMAGGMLFAWIDEWFKKNWVVIDHEIPLERNRLWYNRLDAEQHYGMYAMDAAQPVAGATLAERLIGWRSVTPLYDDGARLRVASDEAYLWLLYEPRAGDTVHDLMIGFDVLDAARGDRRWPGRVGEPLGIGLEFVLHATGDSVRIMADQASNPWTIVPADARSAGPAGRTEMRLNKSVGSVANEDGVYTPLTVTPNRRRFTRAGAEILATSYDRGQLRRGVAPDGLWEKLDDGTMEVRIPWGLINVTDPSQRRVLDNRGAKALSELGTSTVPGIRITVRSTSTTGISSWPLASQPAPLYTWKTWEQPTWSVRERPVYSVMRSTLAALAPAVMR